MRTTARELRILISEGAARRWSRLRVRRGECYRSGPLIMPADSSVSAAVLCWLAVLVVATTLAAAVGVWLILGRLRELHKSTSELGRLEELSASVKKIAADRSDLDLRRVEHVLIEIRDAERRLEDALVRLSESRAAPAGFERSSPTSSVSLAERVTTRLLALGYERVQLVTPLGELEKFADADGEVLIEARRGGVPCKGRVLVRGGALSDVEIKNAYATFP